VRIEGLRYLTETGLINKTIYNSISSIVKEEELEAIKEAKIDAAIILAFDIRNPWLEGRLSILRGTADRKGLLKVAKEAGIRKLMVDTCVTNVPSIGVCSRAIYAIKNEFGIPTGCSPANATTRWKRPKKEWGPSVAKACEASLQTVTLAMCADFLLYGPIESANWIFPACASIDAIIATASKELMIEPLTKEHPLFKLFPEFAKKLEKMRLSLKHQQV
jgi:tetrahydromethanopterin S-methyltransferase subunit H